MIYKIKCNLFIVFFCFIFLTGCDKAFLVVPSGEDYLQEERSRLILQDDEPWEVIVDNDLRSFDIRQPLVISLTHESQYDNDTLKKQEVILSDEFRITSYLLQSVKNVEIWARFSGVPEEFLLLKIEELPPLAQQIYKIPIIYKAGTYLTRNGRWIDIPQMADLHNSMLSLNVSSSDEFFQKFAQLRTAWEIQFLNKDGKSDLNWVKMTPLDCREWLAVVSNLAYTWSSPEFDILVDYYSTIVADSKNQTQSAHFIRTPQKEENLAQFYTTDIKQIGQKDLNGDLITKERIHEDKKNLYHTLFMDREDGAVKKLSLGLVSGHNGAVGLGGGSVFGIAYYHLFSHYKNGCATAVHEIGHCFGYEHGSSMCYGTMEDYLPNLMTMFVRTKQAPYFNRDLVGYYQEKYDKLYPHLDRNQLRKNFGGDRAANHFNHFERFAKTCPQLFPEKTISLLSSWISQPQCTKIDALEKIFQ